MALAEFHTGTKAETLLFLKEADRPLEGISDLMSQIEDEQGVKEWKVCVSECRICRARYVTVAPDIMANEDHECESCGSMTSCVIEEGD